ncbi:MAG TPA: hypothetical protein VL283_04915, partial [Candidatus Baltobacteraceae bacterium]|nr:hypothetical protein [Candidatus Baltobacteraceae bacterium]
REDVYGRVMAGFPDVTAFRLKDLKENNAGGGRKRFYVGQEYYSGREYGASRKFAGLSDVWREIITEADSDEFKELLQDATGVSLNSICNLGFAYGKEGSVQEAHLDGAVSDMGKAISASIAGLLYLNRAPGGVSGTRVYATDRKTVLFEVPDLRNSFFFFEQHPDAWHGFPEVPAGADRRIVSLSYSDEPKAIRLNDSYLYAKMPLGVKRWLQRIS